MFMTFLIEKTTKEGIGKTKSLPLFKFEAMGIERHNTEKRMDWMLRGLLSF